MKRFVPLCVLIAVSSLADARPVRNWSYEELLAESDVVVIATPTASQDLKEPAVVPNVVQAGEDGKSKPVPAIGVETTFEVQAVLKGERKDLGKGLTLYHL